MWVLYAQTHDDRLSAHSQSLQWHGFHHATNYELKYGQHKFVFTGGPFGSNSYSTSQHHIIFWTNFCLILHTFFFHLSMKLHIDRNSQSYFFGICTLSSSWFLYLAHRWAHIFQEMLSRLRVQKHPVMSLQLTTVFTKQNNIYGSYQRFTYYVHISHN